MSKILYNIGNAFYFNGIQLLSLFNKKAKKWVTGRKDWKTKLDSFTAKNSKPIIWMHAASLGEFEQGRPVLEKLKLAYKDYSIVLSFFSPSGYEIQKKYKHADFICYLPKNTNANAKYFIKKLEPAIVLWVKYDFWSSYLFELKKIGIPTILFSANFRVSQPFFNWYGKYWKEMLTCYTHVFVQNEDSKSLLEGIGITAKVINDTRFDRVIEVAATAFKDEKIEHFIGVQPCIVAGSTWLEDEEELSHYAKSNKHLKFIIAPHHIDVDRIKEVKALFPHAVNYSEYDSSCNTNTIILNTMGGLAFIYRYASICYVGGGFGDDGVHNTLEPAAYGKPVVFGPVFEKYKEAIGLVNENAALVIETATELENTCNQLLTDPDFYSETANNAKQYVLANTGGSNTLVNFIINNKLLK